MQVLKEPIYLVDLESGDMICVKQIDEPNVFTTDIVFNIYTKEKVHRFSPEIDFKTRKGCRRLQYNKTRDEWSIKMKGTNNKLVSFIVPRPISDTFKKPKRITRSGR